MVNYNIMPESTVKKNFYILQVVCDTNHLKMAGVNITETMQ